MVTQIKMDKTVNGSIDDFVHVAALSISYKMDLRKVCLYYNTWINLEEINSISCFFLKKNYNLQDVWDSNIGVFTGAGASLLCS